MTVNKRLRKFCLIATSSILLVIVSLYFGHPILLRYIGRFLIVSDELHSTDCIVILSGGYGNRIAAGIELFKQEKANVLVVTGPPIKEEYFFKGYLPCNPTWAELMRLYAIDHGVPERQIRALPSKAQSTNDEAKLIIEFLKANRWKSFILVTSNYHTRRANLIFTNYAREKGLKFYVYPAPDLILPDEWWTCRECSKNLFFEYSKLLFYLIRY